MAHVLFLAIVAIWSISFLLMKKATVSFSAPSIAAWRLVGGAAIVALAWWWKFGRLTITRNQWRPLSLVVILGFACPFMLQPVLVARHGSAFVGMTVGFVPLFTVILSIPLLRVYPTSRQTIGVIGALLFLFLLFYDGLRRQIPLSDIALAVSVPLGYALSNIIIRRSLRELPPLELAMTCLVTSSLLVMPLAFWSDSYSQQRLANISRSSIVSLLVLGVLGTGVAQVMFNRLIQERGALFAGMVTNMVPVGALLWGWLDAESISVWQVVALLGITSMVLVVQLNVASTIAPPSEKF